MPFDFDSLDDLEYNDLDADEFCHECQGTGSVADPDCGIEFSEECPVCLGSGYLVRVP